jgi:hypothetical protein
VRLHIRLGWIMALLVLLPGVPAAWMARQLVTKSLNLGLSSEIDAALGSGIRQSRDFYLRQRQDLADSLDTRLANVSGVPMTLTWFTASTPSRAGWWTSRRWPRGARWRKPWPTRSRTR